MAIFIQMQQFPLHACKTIVKDINFCIAPYIQICDNLYKIILTC
jgi:hypothetical protein